MFASYSHTMDGGTLAPACSVKLKMAHTHTYATSAKVHITALQVHMRVKELEMQFTEFWVLLFDVLKDITKTTL